MVKRISIIAVLLVIGLCGCNRNMDASGADGGSVLEQPLIGDETTEDVVETTEQESTEILIPPNGEIHYTEVELKIVKNALKDEESAQQIMEELNQFGIYNIIRADLLGEPDDNKLEIETADNRVFVIYFYESYHSICAIEKDGEYLYMEIQ